MKLYSYVVARDYGFAPNPFYRFCTLATCKPIIRRVAKVGDWVVGTGSKLSGREGYIVFAMRVTECLTFDEYWSDPRFSDKRPRLSGSKKQAFGDNIYHRDPRSHVWNQVNSHHSHPDGCANQRNVENDTKTNRVLVSNDFTYWGGAGPKLPSHFRNHAIADLCAGRGHKSTFPDAIIREFIEWVRSQEKNGYLGDPLDWSLSP